MELYYHVGNQGSFTDITLGQFRAIAEGSISKAGLVWQPLGKGMVPPLLTFDGKLHWTSCVSCAFLSIKTKRKLGYQKQGYTKQVG